MCAKRHLDPSSCLSTAHECDRQTDGHSCSKEPLYCVARLKADLAQSLICHRRFLVQSDCVRIKGSKEKRKARPSTWNWEGLRCLDSEFFASAWPWTNPNPVFKVMPLFDATYLTNGYRYSHSYYRRRIGNRTHAFEWHQFERPLSQISRSRYYSASNNSQMVQDSYNGGLIESHTWTIEPRHFQWPRIEVQGDWWEVA